MFLKRSFVVILCSLLMSPVVLAGSFSLDPDLLDKVRTTCLSLLQKANKRMDLQLSESQRIRIAKQIKESEEVSLDHGERAFAELFDQAGHSKELIAGHIRSYGGPVNGLGSLLQDELELFKASRQSKFVDLSKILSGRGLENLHTSWLRFYELGWRVTPEFSANDVDGYNPIHINVSKKRVTLNMNLKWGMNYVFLAAMVIYQIETVEKLESKADQIADWVREMIQKKVPVRVLPDFIIRDVLWYMIEKESFLKVVDLYYRLRVHRENLRIKRIEQSELQAKDSFQRAQHFYHQRRKYVDSMLFAYDPNLIPIWQHNTIEELVKKFSRSQP